VNNKRHEHISQKKSNRIFIGSSRIKFDLDIPTWESLNGEKAIQLALVGTSPDYCWKDLANDKNFSSQLVMDVPVLFFLTLRMSINPPKKRSDFIRSKPHQKN
jgi:hypothetical protein